MNFEHNFFDFIYCANLLNHISVSDRFLLPKRVHKFLKIRDGFIPVHKWVYETASKDSFVSIEKAEKILGFKPKYSNKESLIRNYKWYIENLDQFKNQKGVSHRVPWKQGILKIAKIFF